MAIGKLSYSIYLWQQLFIVGRPGIFSNTIVGLLGLAVAACTSYWLLELPLVGLRRKLRPKAEAIAEPRSAAGADAAAVADPAAYPPTDEQPAPTDVRHRLPSAID